MAESVAAPIYLPPEIVSSIHSYLTVAEFHSAQSKQITLFSFAGTCALYREMGLAKADYVVGLRDAGGITKEYKEFVEILRGNPKMVEGIKSLDLRCPNTQEKHYVGVWKDTRRILAMVRGITKLEMRFGTIPTQFETASTNKSGKRLMWNGLCDDLRELKAMEEFCWDESWNAFQPKIDHISPAWNNLTRLNLIDAPYNSTGVGFQGISLDGFPRLFPRLQSLAVSTTERIYAGSLLHVFQGLAKIPSVVHLVIVDKSTRSTQPTTWTYGVEALAIELSTIESIAPRLQSLECVDFSGMPENQGRNISYRFIPAFPLLTHCTTLRLDISLLNPPDDISSLIRLRHLSSFVEITNLPRSLAIFSTLLATAPGSMESFTLLIRDHGVPYEQRTQRCMNAIKSYCDSAKTEFILKPVKFHSYWH